MNISEHIVRDLVRVDFQADNKQQALEKIADLACLSSRLKGVSREDVLRRLTEREAAVSTGIGNGVAIPHTRMDEIDDFMVFALVSPNGVKFEALDKRPVKIFFVVLAPAAKVSEHLKLLAGLSLALSRTGLKREMLKTSNPDILYEVLVRYLGGNGPMEEARRRERKLLVLVLYYSDILNDVLEFLVDMNVEGATIMRSEGMGAHLSGLPLFASFLGFMREDRHASHTIMALIPAAEEADIIHGIEAITGDLEKTRGAALITLDVSSYKGTMSMI